MTKSEDKRLEVQRDTKTHPDLCQRLPVSMEDRMNDMTDFESILRRHLAGLIDSGEIGTPAHYTERYGHWHEVVVGIGNDHVVHITFDSETATAILEGGRNEDHS